MSDIIKCKLCGETLEPGLKYCGCCGAAITEEKETVIPTEQAGFSLDFSQQQQSPSLNYEDGVKNLAEDDTFLEHQNENIVEKESVYQSLSTSEMAMPSNYTDGKSGGSKKGLIIAIISVLILAIIGVCTYLFFPQIAMAVMKPQEYYIMQEKANIKKAMESLEEAFDIKVPAYGANGTARIEVSGGEEVMGEDITKAINSMNADFTFSQSENAKEVKMLTNYYMGEENILKFLIEQANDKIAISFPDISDKKIVEDISTELTKKIFTGDENEIIAMTGMSKKQLEDLGNKYLKKVFIEAFPKESIEKGKSIYNDKTYTTATFNFDSGAIKSMAAALADELEADKDVMVKMIQNLITYSELKTGVPVGSSTVASDYNEFIGSLRIISAGIENVEPTSEVSLKIYYDSRGKIAVREISVDDEKILLAAYKAGNVNNFNLEVISTDGSSFAINAEYKLAKGVYDGTAEIVVDNSQVANMKFSSDTTKKVGGVATNLINADMNISNVLSLKITNDVSGDTVNTVIAFQMSPTIADLGVKLIFDIKTNNTPDLAGINIPAEPATEEEMYDLYSQVEEQLMQKIYDAIGIDFGEQPYESYISDDINAPDNMSLFQEKIIAAALDDTGVLLEELMRYDMTENEYNFTKEELAQLGEIIGNYNAGLE